MTFSDNETLARFSDGLSRTIEIGLKVSEDPRSDDLRRFCDDLDRRVPRLTVKTENGEGNDLPHIRLQHTIRYQAVPLGPELTPFLEALRWLDTGPPSLPENDRHLMDTLQAPAFVQVFIAPHCPHCPAAIRTLLPLAAANRGIRVTVIDGTLFTEAAAAADVRSAPLILLDRQFRWAGPVAVDELLEMATKRDPARLGAASLRSLVEEGKAAQVAEMMQAAQAVFPAFVELLYHEKWPVRLGAMVVFEYLAEADPNLAAKVADPLWERFGGVDDTTKGDIIHILGQTGRKELIPRLTVISASSASEELRAAAVEAVQFLSESEL